MRLFIAALLPDGVRKDLYDYINILKPETDGVKWEKSNKLHITLKFLGNVDESRIEDISGVISRIVPKYSRFKLGIAEFGGFPNLKNPRVLYAGTTENKMMAEFQSALEDSLMGLGFEKDKRSFTPHITLGRVKKKMKHGELPSISHTDFEIKTIGLMKSDTKPEGSVYSALRIFDLAS